MRYLALPVLIACMPGFSYSIQTRKDFEKSPFFQKYTLKATGNQTVDGGYQYVKYASYAKKSDLFPMIEVSVMLAPNDSGTPSVRNQSIRIYRDAATPDKCKEIFEVFTKQNDLAPKDLANFQGHFDQINDSKAKSYSTGEFYDGGKFFVEVTGDPHFITLRIHTEKQ